MTYDEVGRVVTDRSGLKSYYDYDPMKRVTRMQDSMGNSATYRYDKMGQMTKLTDGKGNVTQWAYDDMNRLSSKTYHDGTYESYAYNVQANKVTFTDTKGQVTTSSYDDVGNLTQSATQNAPTVNLTYDNLDRVYTMADGVGTTTMGYDILSRVTSVDGPFANDTVGYHYDTLGRRDQLQVNAQGSTTDTSAYGYDALSRLKTITNGVGVWNYAYVGNTGRLNTLTAPNSTVATYAYDSLDRLQQVQNTTSTSSLISKYAYGYTNVAHKDARSFMERTVGTQGLQHVNYSYDNTNQLMGEQSTETTAIANVPYVNNTYAYDAMGNRSASLSTSLPVGGNTTTSSASKTHNALNQITAQTITTAVNGTTSSTRNDTFGYDNAGNLNTISNSVDSSGTTYVYDGLNRLVNVLQKNASGTNTTKSEFVYDGMSRKVISREYTWNGSAWVLTPNSEVRRIYDGMDVVQERDASNNVITKYTRAGNIGGLLSKSVSSNGWSTRYDYFYHYDGSGNVTQMTDVSQNTVAEYAYDAYGNTTRMVGTQASANLYRFSTKEYHSQSGLYDYGLRFYSPGLGRWINRDPIAESGGLNLYAMVGNNPVNAVDPSGENAVIFYGTNASNGDPTGSYFGAKADSYAHDYVVKNWNPFWPQYAYVMQPKSLADIQNVLNNVPDIDTILFVSHGGQHALYLTPTFTLTQSDVKKLPMLSVDKIGLLACHTADSGTWKADRFNITQAFAHRFDSTDTYGVDGGLSFGLPVYPPRVLKRLGVNPNKPVVIGDSSRPRPEHGFVHY